MAPGDHRELHRPFQETLTYIEFLGMSGVGKTAACELMIRAFRARARASGVCGAGGAPGASEQAWDLRQRLAGAPIDPLVFAPWHCVF